LGSVHICTTRSRCGRDDGDYAAEPRQEKPHTPAPPSGPNVGRDKTLFCRFAGGCASARYAAGEWTNMRNNLAERHTGLIVCGLCRRNNAAVPAATNCRKWLTC
jgi:hypothetical protein